MVGNAYVRVRMQLERRRGMRTCESEGGGGGGGGVNREPREHKEPREPREPREQRAESREQSAERRERTRVCARKRGDTASKQCTKEPFVRT